ncbi:MAG: Lipase 3 precursor [Betaproteobacteria bacterium ADurb.Bin341]|nr:MAG: Lipase 3 precursor [Betaproteobacteria bacterium ADurb.Bin341]
MDSKNIQIGNTRYAYYELPNPGKAKMLLLHGMLVESHCFEAMTEDLKANYHLVLLDLKGHGKSDNGKSYDADYTNDAIAADLLTFQQAVIQEPFHLVGYSLGGQYSLKFAGTHPELVKSVTLIDSAPALSTKGVFLLLYALFTTPKFFRNKEHVYRHYDNRLAGLGDYMFKHCVVEGQNGRYLLRYDKKNLAPNTLAKSALRTKDLWESSKHIKSPVLILRAEKSAIIDHKIERTMKTNMPHAQIVLMKNMGHELVFSKPKEVSEQIEAFIRRC